jgi:hypothetical protein
MSVNTIDSVELGTDQEAELDEYGWLSIVQNTGVRSHGWGLSAILFDAAAALRLLELLKKHEEWLVRERDGLTP